MSDKYFVNIYDEIKVNGLIFLKFRLGLLLFSLICFFKIFWLNLNNYWYLLDFFFVISKGGGFYFIGKLLKCLSFIMFIVVLRIYLFR